VSVADLKLPKLPDRTPVKLTITLTPDLKQALEAYGELYERTYGRSEPIGELAVAILARFLESDKAFVRWCREVTGRNE
jgi:hypothetical protein